LRPHRVHAAGLRYRKNPLDITDDRSFLLYS